MRFDHMRYFFFIVCNLWVLVKSFNARYTKFDLSTLNLRAQRAGLHRRSLVVLLARGDDLDGLKVDQTKLSKEEAERLEYIQKISLEADEMVRAAGFNIDDYDESEEVERAVKDTKWAGQSEVEETRKSSRNWGDVINRPGLAIGDIAALTAFAAVGRSNHGEGIDIVSALTTAAPFIISWLAISPLLGAYTREATSGKGNAFTGLLGGWAVSVPVGLAIRGALKGDIPPTPFIIVSMVATLAFLSVWRFLFVSLIGSTSDEEYREAGFFEVFKMIGTLVRRW